MFTVTSRALVASADIRFGRGVAIRDGVAFIGIPGAPDSGHVALLRFPVRSRHTPHSVMAVWHALSTGFAARAARPTDR